MISLRLSQGLWLLLALVGPSATQQQTQGSTYPSPGTSCCLRPIGSQDEFEVGMVLGEEDFIDRRDYYADFGKEMVPEGSMVLYKGRMGLLNKDCSVSGLEYGYPFSGIPYLASSPWMTLATMLVLSSLLRLLTDY
jgi:hypothetical protein